MAKVGMSPEEELAEIIAEAEVLKAKDEAETESSEPVAEGDHSEPEQTESPEVEPDQSDEGDLEAEKAENVDSEDAESLEEGQSSENVATDEAKPEANEKLFPRGAQRRINKLTSEKNALLKELDDLRQMIQQPGENQNQNFQSEAPNQEQQLQYQARINQATATFQSNLQKTLQPHEIEQVRAIQDIEVGPMTSATLLEHPLGPQIALEISRNEFVKDLLSSQDDFSAVNVINALGNELQYRNTPQQVQKPIQQAEPNLAEKKVAKNKAPKPTPKTDPNGKGVVAPENMSEEQMEDWVLRTTGRK